MIDPFYAETLFNDLYTNINGYQISNDARAKYGQDTEKLLYGELPFETCQNIINQIRPKEHGVFFDLGSGTGRVVMAAYLLHNFRKSIGIELLGGLHDTACEIKERFEKNALPHIGNKLEGNDLQFHQANIFDVDLREADMIFMNHPFKDGEIFTQLEEKFLTELKPGTKIVTIIRALKHPRFRKIGNKTYNFSWGNSTAYFAEVI